ncbi:MAG: hypothetical protein RL213_1888, partial [Bacteroidota bacterium]
MQKVIGSTPISSTKSPGYGAFSLNMFFVYILYSRSADRYYVGQTDNPEKRLSDHNAGISGYTSQAGDWIIVHLE